eukprot:4684267-Pleurochrysis_carterae.AAC.1
MSIGRDEGRLRCPSGKRELLLAALAELQAELANDATVPWRQARSVVGKLANLAQALPELKLVLRGGYAVARPAGSGACRREGPAERRPATPPARRACSPRVAPAARRGGRPRFDE